VHRGTPWHFFGGMIAEATKGNTWFGRTVFEAVAFLKTRHATGAAPDLQILSLPWAYPSPNQDLPIRPTVDTRPSITMMVTMIYPKSRGEMRLASADPTAAPLIDPHYLEDPADVRFLLDAVQTTREMMAHPTIAGELKGELHPGDQFRDEAALARELPTRVHTAYHPVGTCRVGTDARAVVDPQLRVRGIDGLRVADASIMPNVIGGNTNAPCMMIGERCAELMLTEAGVTRAAQAAVAAPTKKSERSLTA
jgi:choline dehydrogenase-like flavoprotein